MDNKPNTHNAWGYCLATASNDLEVVRVQIPSSILIASVEVLAFAKLWLRHIALEKGLFID